MTVHSGVVPRTGGMGRAGAARPVGRARSGAVAVGAVAPLLVFLVIALAGRYSFERAGVRGLDLLDLRLVGLTVGFALLAFALAKRPYTATAGVRREGWLVAAGLFFLYQIASGLWAPATARTGEKAMDVALLAMLTLGVYLHARAFPRLAVRWTFAFSFVTALVFALGALVVTGPGAQGRYAAFGGGPNVFVRIELLGVLGAVALYLVGRGAWRFLPLAAAPLLVVAAVLSGSRGGLLSGLVIAVAALVWARGRIPARPALVVAASAVVVGAAAWAVASPALSGLVQSRFVEQTAQQAYTSGRTEIWRGAVEIAAAHPAVGAGLDGFYGLIGRSAGIEYPHNYVLGTVAEGGAVGLALLVAAVLLWTLTVRRGLSAQTPAAGARSMDVALAVAAAAFVALDSMFSGDYYDARLAWMFAALAAAACGAARDRAC